MKNLLTAASAALMVASLAVSPASAQQFQQGVNAPKFGIAVVDMNFIFQEHATFKTEMASLKTQMEGIEGQLKTQRDSIAAKEEQLGRLQPGTQDYKNLDNDLATAKAQFNLTMNRQRKALMEKESMVYYNTYTQVRAAIDAYAKQYEIGLVLRFNGDELDPNKPQELIKAINNPIVFQNSIDITGDIVARLNGGAAPAAGAPAASAAARPGTLPPRQ